MEDVSQGHDGDNIYGHPFFLLILVQIVDPFDVKYIWRFTYKYVKTF